MKPRLVIIKCACCIFWQLFLRRLYQYKATKFDWLRHVIHKQTAVCSLKQAKDKSLLNGYREDKSESHDTFWVYSLVKFVLVLISAVIGLAYILEIG